MRNRLAIAAALAASMGPMLGGAEVVKRDSPIEDWLRANGKLKAKGKRMTREVSRLQLRAYARAEIKSDAPEGYFWHQAANGVDSYYLLKKAPGERVVVYDKQHDRSIIESGWGYVKPTYAPGDVR